MLSTTFFLNLKSFIHWLRSRVTYYSWVLSSDKNDKTSLLRKLKNYDAEYLNSLEYNMLHLINIFPIILVSNQLKIEVSGTIQVARLRRLCSWTSWHYCHSVHQSCGFVTLLDCCWAPSLSRRIFNASFCLTLIFVVDFSRANCQLAIIALWNSFLYTNYVSCRLTEYRNPRRRRIPYSSRKV